MVLSVQETGKQGTGSIHRICRCKSGSGRLIVRLVSGRCPCFPVFCALRTILPSLYEIPGGHTDRSHSLRIVLMMWGWLWDCGGESGWGWRNAGGSLWVGTDGFWGNAQGGCACCARVCRCVRLCRCVWICVYGGGHRAAAPAVRGFGDVYDYGKGG